MCNELLKHLETCQIANPPQLNGSEYTCLQIEQSRFGFYPARFDLARNRVGDRGALSLAAALPRCHLHAGFSEARKQLKPQKTNDTMNNRLQQTSTDPSTLGASRGFSPVLQNESIERHSSLDSGLWTRRP